MSAPDIVGFFAEELPKRGITEPLDYNTIRHIRRQERVIEQAYLKVQRVVSRFIDKHGKTAAQSSQPGTEGE